MKEKEVTRKTNETDIYVKLNIDGSGQVNIDTGVGFMDHMLSLMAFHGRMDLTVRCRGDMDVDTHHTLEDLGICMGTALREASGDMSGIERYGFMLLPMDEALARIALDVSGRSCLIYDVKFSREHLGSMAAEDMREFFQGFVRGALITLHISLLYGTNDHHKVEAVFKGLGQALSQAYAATAFGVTSTKGVI